MKKIFSILIASIILLSGMHLSVANHFCESKNVATKVSFDGEKATCGMEKKETTNHPLYPIIASNCCHDDLSVCSVDNQYVPSSLDLKKADFQLLTVLFIPVNSLLYSFSPKTELHTNVFPPGNLLTNEVSLSRICVFRI
jgi:hypothetical protein